MDAQLYDACLTVAATLIAAGFVLMAWRVIVGPKSLDRVLGNDGITASLQCALALYICWTLDTTVVNVMIVIALLGFIASLAVARFRKRDGAL